MMGWTNRHCRAFHRVVAPSARLYTEMVHALAVVHAHERVIAFSDCEQPVALQLGGNIPHDLAQAARIAARAGYVEINLNCGCPSERVQHGGFGASLMLDPCRVQACVRAMADAVALPITVKCRLGVNNQFSYQQFADFVSCLHDENVPMVIVHARQAWLDGLSAKENRNVPPLQYDWVYRVKNDFPSMKVILNGGVDSVASALDHLRFVDGVMLGRAAYHNPYLLHQLDSVLTHVQQQSRAQLLQNWQPYIEKCVSSGVALGHLLRHTLGLFHGQRGGKAFRRFVNQNRSGQWQNVAEIIQMLEK